jgi:hypothetical protein
LAVVVKSDKMDHHAGEEVALQRIGLPRDGNSEEEDGKMLAFPDMKNMVVDEAGIPAVGARSCE